MRRATFLLVSLCFATGTTGLGAEPRMPRMALHEFAPGSRYLSTASFSVSGKVTPPLHASVAIRVSHLRDDERLDPMWAGDVRLGADGTFSVQVYPPAGGWTSGVMRVDASVVEMRQVRAFTTAEVVDLGPVMPEPRDIPSEPTLRIDGDAKHADPLPVPLGERFILHGTFPSKQRPVIGKQGTFITASLWHLGMGGKRFGTGGASSLSFDAGDGVWWFEIEVDAFTMAGLSVIELNVPGEDPATRETREILVSVEPKP